MGEHLAQSWATARSASSTVARPFRSRTDAARRLHALALAAHGSKLRAGLHGRRRSHLRIGRRRCRGCCCRAAPRPDGDLRRQRREWPPASASGGMSGLAHSCRSVGGRVRRHAHCLRASGRRSRPSASRSGDMGPHRRRQTHRPTVPTGTEQHELEPVGNRTRVSALWCCRIRAAQACNEHDAGCQRARKWRNRVDPRREGSAVHEDRLFPR